MKKTWFNDHVWVSSIDYDAIDVDEKNDIV